jgi:hypothetical protein
VAIAPREAVDKIFDPISSERKRAGNDGKISSVVVAVSGAGAPAGVGGRALRKGVLGAGEIEIDIDIGGGD